MRGRRASGRRSRSAPSAAVVAAVGGAALLAVFLVVLLTSGPSGGGGDGRGGGGSGRGAGRPASPVVRPPAASTSGVSPAEARDLARRGREEYELGVASLRAAGEPGSPGEQSSLASAQSHLSSARDLLARAAETLPNDPGIARLGEDCARHLSACMKRIIPGR